MPNTTDMTMMKNYNDPPTPRQNAVFKKLSGIPRPEVIVARAGVSIAIGVLIAARTSAGRAGIGSVLLPGSCFYRRYTACGVPREGTIIDPKYENGATIAMLQRAKQSLGGIPDEPSHGKEVRRPGLELSSPQLPELTQVKRNYLGGK